MLVPITELKSLFLSAGVEITTYFQSLDFLYWIEFCFELRVWAKLLQDLTVLVLRCILFVKNKELLKESSSVSTSFEISFYLLVGLTENILNMSILFLLELLFKIKSYRLGFLEKLCVSGSISGL